MYIPVGVKPVHEILYSKRLGGRALVAFIQHGTSTEGFRYEGICPYCTLTIGMCEEVPGTQGVPEELFKTELLAALKDQIKDHIPKCTASWTVVRVQKTRTPLNTERIIKEV